MLQNLIILGPPGAGKGTLAKRISKEYNLNHISAGELIRQELTNQNPLMLKLVPFLDF